MQTIQIEVKDNYLVNVMAMLESVKDVMIENIEFKKDSMLAIDPYFYERKKHIAQTIEDIESGKMKMYDFDESMDELIQELES